MQNAHDLARQSNKSWWRLTRTDNNTDCYSLTRIARGSCPIRGGVLGRAFWVGFI